METPPRQEGVYIPGTDPTLRTVKNPEAWGPRAAEAHKWTKAVLEQALDDLRGLVLLKKEKADEFLKEVGQRENRHWIDN